MQRSLSLLAAAIAALAPVCAVASGVPAAADPGTPVYPGMEIRQDTTLCTVGFVDPVRRIAFTAGHCRGSGPVTDRDGRYLGNLAAFHDNTPNGMTIDPNHVMSDWETIGLAADAAATDVLPSGRQLISDPGFVAAPGQPVCHFGVVTGESCGTVDAVNNGWFTMANGVVSQKGDSGGPVYVVRDDGRAVIIGMFNSTWGTSPAAVSWHATTQQI